MPNDLGSERRKFIKRPPRNLESIANQYEYFLIEVEATVKEMSDTADYDRLVVKVAAKLKEVKTNKQRFALGRFIQSAINRGLDSQIPENQIITMDNKSFMEAVQSELRKLNGLPSIDQEEGKGPGQGNEVSKRRTGIARNVSDVLNEREVPTLKSIELRRRR